MLDTLYGKTFLILGAQLGVTWLSTVVLLQIFRNLYYAKVSWISAAIKDNGELDLDLDWGTVKNYFWTLLIANIAVFLVLLFWGQQNLTVGIPLFTLWSVLTGIELALCLVAVDENLGARVLALTALITCAAGLIGAKSGIDFSFLSMFLFVALLLLILFGLARILFAIPRWVQRISAGIGVLIFTGYLLFDFNRLSYLNKHPDANNWTVAMGMAISIYLDIINLFLELLDLISR